MQYQFSIGALEGGTEYTPFSELKRATEVARANSLQDSLAYGVWNEDDELLIVVVDGEIFAHRPAEGEKER